MITYFTLLYLLYSLIGNQHSMHPYNIHIYIVHVKHATKGNSFFFLDGRIFMSAGHDNLMLRDDTSAETLAMCWVFVNRELFCASLSATFAFSWVFLEQTWIPNNVWLFWGASLQNSISCLDLFLSWPQSNLRQMIAFFGSSSIIGHIYGKRQHIIPNDFDKNNLMFFIKIEYKS